VLWPLAIRHGCRPGAHLDDRRQQHVAGAGCQRPALCFNRRRARANPEEDIRLSKQKSALARRAYRLDLQHFARTLSITTPDELRQADHKAVIAWERYMRETEHAAASTIRRGLRRCPLSIST